MVQVQRQVKIASTNRYREAEFEASLHKAKMKPLIPAFNISADKRKEYDKQAMDVHNRLRLKYEENKKRKLEKDGK